jgi:hypothetical protein
VTRWQRFFHHVDYRYSNPPSRCHAISRFVSFIEFAPQVIVVKLLQN